MEEFDFCKVYESDPNKTDMENLLSCVAYMQLQVSLLCSIELAKQSAMKKRRKDRNNGGNQC